MRNAISNVTGLAKAHRRAAVVAACFVTVFAIALAGPVSFVNPTLGGTLAYAKGKGKGKGLESAPGQTGQHEDDIADIEDAGEAGPAERGASMADRGDGPFDTATDEIPDDVPPAHVTVIKELVGLPEKSALSDEEEMEAIRSGWDTWRTADGPGTIMAQ